jgi:hypothetical protein
MRDATGEFLKSQIDSFSELDAEANDIIRRYSQLKELEKYKKSLVFSESRTFEQAKS